VECLASAYEQIVKHVPPVVGGTGAAATEDIVGFPANYWPSALDDSLLKVFLQTVIRSSKSISLEIAKEKELLITWAQSLSLMKTDASSFEA
jgi:hypothetical protein